MAVVQTSAKRTGDPTQIVMANTATTTRRMRILRENLTGYVFIAPALVLIFLFGIFPIAFAFFVSLHRWRRFPEEFLGLDHYLRALDQFAVVLFVWLGIGAVGYAVYTASKLWKHHNEPRLLVGAIVPALASGAAVSLFFGWFAALLPSVLTIPQRMRGREREGGIFVEELFISLREPEIAVLGSQFLIALIVAVALIVIYLRLTYVRPLDPAVPPVDNRTRLITLWTTVLLAVAVGILVLDLAVREMVALTEMARAAGESLPIGGQVALISAGVGLLVGAYALWQRAVKSESNRRFIGFGLVTALAMGGGVLLITELPTALAQADQNVLNGLAITFMFAVGTVPAQLVIGLGLAVLLFRDIRAKSLFRVVYFLPYIMPFVATSVVFRILFSHRPSSPANQLLDTFGIPAQQWLLEPTPILQLIFGESIPAGLAGPSLALIVIMLYTVWTYIGYDAVIFLAGLGTIPNELNEAARIDGANEWQIFRHLTLPLLSPTTFFLTLIALTGTFRAFTQIWIMRTPASQRSVDTLGVYIFETVRAVDPNLGYGSAMALVLFVIILILTVFQNRIAGSRVFYG